MKYFIIITIFLTPILSGCNCDKNTNNIIEKQNNIDKQDKIVIKTDKILQPDIEKRLEKLVRESIFPIEINSDSDNPEIIISTNNDTIDSSWNNEEIYKYNKKLIPQVFADKFADKINDFIIYAVATENKNNKIIIDYLKTSFNENPPNTTTITFAGDIMLSRWVAKRINQYGIDYPFKNLSDYLQKADLTVGNLESPASESGPYETAAGTMSFRYDPKITPELKKTGFDIFNLANNHFGNAGKQGMEFTMKNLIDNNIEYFGAGENSEKSREPLIKEINGIKFTFLGYSDSSITPSSYEAKENSPGLNLDSIEKMQEDVKNAKSKADYIIVSMHLGTEYQNKPNQKQINFAQKAIDTGADFIYGHHPHVIQTIDFIDNKPVFYSLGNFIFDQYQPNTRQGLVVSTKFVYNQLVEIELKSVEITNFAQPNWENQSQIDKILKRIN